MIKKLIINADDFGLTEGVSKGIIDAHLCGVLTSTTLLMNMPSTKKAIQLAKENPKLGLGIHLNMTLGTPLIGDKAKSLTDDTGKFLPPRLMNSPNYIVDLDELYHELTTQMNLFTTLVGKLPTHIDSHHHMHMLPQYRGVFDRVAKDFGVVMRSLPLWRQDKLAKKEEYIQFNDDFYGLDLTVQSLISIMTRYAETLEIMSHPGYIDDDLHAISSYTEARLIELEILKSPELRQFIDDVGIELVTYITNDVKLKG